MRHLILGGLSFMLISTANTPIVQAQQTTVVVPTTLQRTPSKQLQPVDLVSLAYQGRFRQQGIPSYGALVAAYQTGRIDAENLVQSAVTANRVTAEVLANRRYLNAVDLQLRSLAAR